MRSGGGRSRAGVALGALLAAGLLAAAAGVGADGTAGPGGVTGAGSASTRVTLVPVGPPAGAGTGGGSTGSQQADGRGRSASARAASAGSTAAGSKKAAASSGTGSSSHGASGARRRGAAGTLQPGGSGRTGVVLPVGACVARPVRGRAEYRELGCSEPAAYGRVTVRLPAGTASPAPCPADTDFELGLATAPARPAGTSGGPASEPDGVACLRTLHGPHPGDPGHGGGAGIVRGDCLAATGSARIGGTPVRETACARGARPAAEYRVVAITAAPGSRCPSATRYLIAIRNPGQDQRTACAVLAG